MICRMKSLAAFALGALLLASASSAPAQVGPSGYTIGPRDLLELQVYEVPELNVQRRVTENGIVRLPLLGDVPVQGLTVPELIDSLERLLEETYVERASVNVEVLEFRSRPISIIGAVRKPGDLGLPTGWTLLEALSAAGGLAESHGDRVHVLRRAGNGLTDQISIPLDALMTRADPRANIPLFANDLIHVEPRTKVNVYCLGEIASPGALAFDSTERITVLSAIARAGGLTDRASSKIVIRRPGEGGQVREIEVSYKRILAGKEADPPLTDGDMLVVKESFF